MFGLKISRGILFNCIYREDLTCELLIARPFKNWRAWFRKYSNIRWNGQQMHIITFSGFEFRKKMN